MSMPKSKDARRKMRRWSYEIRVTRDGVTRKLPAGMISIGNSRLARTNAERITQDVKSLPQFEGDTVSVHPIAHEPISQEMMDQLNGLSNENRLLIDVARDLVKLTLVQSGTENPTEEQITESLQARVMAKKQDAFADLQAKAEAKAQELGGEAVVFGEGGDIVTSVVTGPESEAEIPDAANLEAEL